MRRLFCFLVATIFVSMTINVPALAETTPSAQTQREISTAWSAARRTAILGPAQISLLDEAKLNLPAGEAFIPATEANAIMRALGNSDTPTRQGLIVKRGAKASWLIDVRWVKEGYVRDGDAKDWQPAAMLDNLKQGTEAQNADRIARGIPALDITGWVQEPLYDKVSNRLIWSLASRDRGAPIGDPQTINYNTYALGRDGYFSLDLITGADTIGTDKEAAQQLLDGLDYLPGKRYQDFNASTDKVAAYGLAALIGVVAVKKLGLLAIIGAFLFKAWKLGMIAIAGIGAAIRRRLGRKNNRSDQI